MSAQRGKSGNDGKRGPNGGVVDIDDPYEVVEPTRIVLVREIRNALRLVEFAAAERIAGREGNAENLRTKAALKLSNAILAAVGK